MKLTDKQKKIVVILVPLALLLLAGIILLIAWAAGANSILIQTIWKTGLYAAIGAAVVIVFHLLFPQKGRK